MASLFDPECAQPNALVRLTSHLTSAEQQSRALRGSGALRHDIPSTSGAASQQVRGSSQQVRGTLSMHELLYGIEQTTAARPSASRHVQKLNHLDLIDEYLAAPAVQVERPLYHSWTSEYLQSSNPIQRVLPRPPAAQQHATAASWLEQYEKQQQPAVQWLEDYERQQQQNSTQQPQNAADWLKEFDAQQVMEQAWNYATQQDAATSSLDDLDKAWDFSQASQNWFKEYAAEMAEQSNNTYSFATDNPYHSESDALERGKEAMRKGELSRAVLLFEAAVQQDASNTEAWQYLGTAQAENENESAAISALKSALDLQSSNADARLALAVCYTNESLYFDACRELKEWLYQRYPQLVGTDKSSAQTEPNFTHSFVHPAEFSAVESLLLRAVQLPSAVKDADLQNALGILYNVSGDYSKAVDCFMTALQIRPNDARLWSRLGATLANGNRSSEAIPAYSRALQQYPAFVRARYNLGVACLNLQSYRDALEHLLSAARLQSDGLGPSAMSNNIWSSIRYAIRQWNGHDSDMLAMADRKDVEGLSRRLGL